MWSSVNICLPERLNVFLSEHYIVIRLFLSLWFSALHASKKTLCLCIALCMLLLCVCCILQHCNLKSKERGSNYWLWVFVEHDGQELVHRQHPREGFGSQQLPGSLLRQRVAERPVGVVGLHQVVHTVHRLLRLLHLHTLTPHVAGAETEGVCWWGVAYTVMDVCFNILFLRLNVIGFFSIIQNIDI